MLHKCQYCKNEFKDPRKIAKYCSRKCYGEFKSSIPITCKHKDQPRYSSGLCKCCYNKNYRDTNKTKLGLLAKQAQLKREYGISFEQWLKMFKYQQGMCPICLKSLNIFRASGAAANVDHDHKTKRVRGLVCNTCNRIRININTLETARRLVRYLGSTFDGRDI